jgi:uncharacterized membrane protein YbhN (UPF0104 family)
MAAVASPAGLRRSRRRLVLTGVGAIVVGALLARAMAGRGADFVTALGMASLVTLVAATLLQGVALVARSEAWNVCVSAAGGSVARRRLYRAASMGYVGNLINGQFGVAARIAALRRSAPRDSPPVSALIGAEVPILAVEAGLAAITSFTLVGPMGLPWWTPLAALAAVGSITFLLGRLGRRPAACWKGLAALGSIRGEARILGLVLVATFAQIARNWLVLHALGVDASVFDAIAVLIAMVTFSQLPVGPSAGAAATVAVLGPHGVATVAAAGVLLTATGTVGALLYAVWAGLDRALWDRTAARLRARRARGRRVAAGRWEAALRALTGPERRTVEVAYCGGLRWPEVSRLVWPVAAA